MGLLEITKLPTAENAVIHLHASDNIAIARVALSPGQQLRVEGSTITVEDADPGRSQGGSRRRWGWRTHRAIWTGDGPRAHPH